MDGCDNKRLGMGRPTKVHGCYDVFYKARHFFSDLIIPPWEVFTFKAELLVHEKNAKEPVENFYGGGYCGDLPYN